MDHLNQRLSSLDIPQRIVSRPRDKLGYPVPWFVSWAEGKPDFHQTDVSKIKKAYEGRLCWTCGDRLGRFATFVMTSMSTILRVSDYLPSHHDCAMFAARACPHFSLSKAEQGRAPTPDGPLKLPIIALWTTTEYQAFNSAEGEVSFQVGDPNRVEWLARSRSATRAEVMLQMDEGIPVLRQSTPAHSDLDRLIDEALNRLPAE